MFRLSAFLLVCICLCSCVWNGTESNPDFLVLDDSEYPYAGLPRLVIETENFAQIQDKETKIPAKLQVYGENGPESEIMDLEIKGRGNSSFKMPKYGYKIKLSQKKGLLGMLDNRDWVLIANFRDKTHLKNHISSQLAEKLGDDYTTHSQFIELFINHEYLGLYQLSENVKTGRNRINIKDSDFLLEKTTSSSNKPYFMTKHNNLFEIKNPKIVTTSDINKVKNHLNNFEDLISSKACNLSQLKKWLDVKDFIRYYWIQELSKNLDGKFQRSIFITWEQDDVIKMGPVWDFDLGYGIGMVGVTTDPFSWEIRKTGWFKWLWKEKDFAVQATDFWKENHSKFTEIANSIDSTAATILSAVKNDNKRWPVLDTDENLYHETQYSNYAEAIDSLKSWIQQRINWIDNNLD